MMEKRINPRSLCADLVHLEWIDGAGHRRMVPGVLEDISVLGACLQVERPVPVGLDSVVRHNEHWTVPCKTVYCEYREIGYFVGLSFDESKPWSEQVFEPRYLLDPWQLT